MYRHIIHDDSAINLSKRKKAYSDSPLGEMKAGEGGGSDGTLNNFRKGSI